MRGLFLHGDAMSKQMTDREVYPTVWIVSATLLTAFLIWKYLLHEPTIAGCWIYQNLHVYCPGCGGTRSLTALLKGRLLQSLWYHPAVLITAGVTTIYLFSQTLWRLRGKKGWVLHYRASWPKSLLWLIVFNCVLRNFLLLCFGIGL